MEFYFILIWISLSFFILLGVKEIFNKKLKEKFCVLCASIILTWIILLILNFSNLFQDKILIGILMGHTSLGLFYFFESHFKKEIKVFRLPLLLSFISIIYFILEEFEKISFIVLIILWVIFGFIYFFRKSGTKSYINKLINCCKKW